MYVYFPDLKHTSNRVVSPTLTPARLLFWKYLNGIITLTLEDKNTRLNITFLQKIVILNSKVYHLTTIFFVCVLEKYNKKYEETV